MSEVTNKIYSMGANALDGLLPAAKIKAAFEVASHAVKTVQVFNRKEPGFYRKQLAAEEYRKGVKGSEDLRNLDEKAEQFLDRIAEPLVEIAFAAQDVFGWHEENHKPEPQAVAALAAKKEK